MFHSEILSRAVVRLSDDEPVRGSREKCLAESLHLRLTLETIVLTSGLKDMTGFVLHKTWASVLASGLWQLMSLGESLSFVNFTVLFKQTEMER